MRDDSWGIFWQEAPRVAARAKDSGPRPLPPIPETDWVCPEGPDAFPDLSDHGMLSFDVETKDYFLKEKGPGFLRGDAYVCGIALGAESGFRQYYPIAHEMGPNLPKKLVANYVRTQLSRKNQPKVGARLIYDLEALKVDLNIDVAGPLYDIQVAEPLLDETRLSYQLEIISRFYLDEGKKQSVMLDWLRKAFGSDETNIKKFIHRAPPSIAGPYAEGDVDLPLRIFALQREELNRQGLWDLFLMESKLIPMLLAMRIRGVPVDVSKAENLLVVLKEKQEERLAAIKHATGIAPDIWAADSLKTIFDKLGIKYPLTKKTKAPSFRKEWLKSLTHPVGRMITEARGADKFAGTFVQGYILDGAVNGKIHGQFHQLRSEEGGTVSGRFSSSIPNLQNIPTRTAEGKLIREAFIAEQGQKWWKFDWSQVEYRLIAHYAYITKQPGSDEVVRRYNEDAGVDYHQLVADMTGLARGDAKNLNFGLAYGQGVPLLCANLNVDIPTGLQIMQTYHEKAPFIKPLMKLASSQANVNAQITTLLGRKRRFKVWERGNSAHGRLAEEDRNEYASEDNPAHFRHLVSDEQLKRNGWTDEELADRSLRSPSSQRYLRAIRNGGWRRAFLHKALNALIQGSAADVMKKAMVQIWEDGVCDVIGAPHLTVHDELDGSYMPQVKEHVEAVKHVRHVMENCVKLSIPLMADFKTGDNWGELDVVD